MTEAGLKLYDRILHALDTTVNETTELPYEEVLDVLLRITVGVILGYPDPAVRAQMIQRCSVMISHYARFAQARKMAEELKQRGIVK